MHLTAAEAAKLAASADVQALVPVHCAFDPREGLVQRLKKTFKGRIVLGEDGLLLTLP
jgi:ribonuclease BN (tRNA processing enzyme)